ncbi:Imm50 family immunity protein [Streptomyces sp. NPDC006332]|uniref:Imm50 family immunity protein n=1 Tax=Streptomyces sp. NPDC006332 TaxID=3155456 RepID=UPI0033B0C4C6
MTAGFPVRNMEILAPFYGAELPSLRSVPLRSINLNWCGPTVSLRMDLPTPPMPLPAEWTEAGVDTVQCQFQFLAVADLVLDGWEPPVTACLAVDPLPDGRHRILVTASTDSGTFLKFTCSDEVLAGHLSGFRPLSDGSDGGPHVFRSRIDGMRHTTVPDPCEKTFYERL